MMISCRLAPDIVVIGCCLPLVVCFATPAFALLFIFLPELSAEQLVIVKSESLERIETETMTLPRSCQKDEDCLKMPTYITLHGEPNTYCLPSMKQWRSAAGEPI